MKFTVPVGKRQCRFPTEIIARNPVSNPPFLQDSKNRVFHGKISETAEKSRTRQCRFPTEIIAKNPVSKPPVNPHLPKEN